MGDHRFMQYVELLLPILGNVLRMQTQHRIAEPAPAAAYFEDPVHRTGIHSRHNDGLYASVLLTLQEFFSVRRVRLFIYMAVRVNHLYINS